MQVLESSSKAFEVALCESPVIPAWPFSCFLQSQVSARVYRFALSAHFERSKRWQCRMLTLERQVAKSSRSFQRLSCACSACRCSLWPSQMSRRRLGPASQQILKTTKRAFRGSDGDSSSQSLRSLDSWLQSWLHRVRLLSYSLVCFVRSTSRNKLWIKGDTSGDAWS